MKEIAIVTLFDYINIGNRLQNYALQTVIESQGCRVDTIVNKELLTKNTFKDVIKCVLGLAIPKYRIVTLNTRRRRCFQKDALIHATAPMTWDEIQNKMGNAYDGYVAGSDQVWFNWLHIRGEMEFRLLSFVPENKRMCYAPSFGVDRLADGDIEQYRACLSPYRFLSSRERTGCGIIRDLTGKEAELLCDPTMLLSAHAWDGIMKKPRHFPENHKYVLVYFLSSMTPAQKRAIEEYAWANKLDIIDVYNPWSPQYYCTTPRQFLYLMKNASYVFTNSFHGTVFSILYHRHFTVYLRETDNSRMNDRIGTLLNMFSLEKHVNAVSEDFDYDAIEQELKRQREKGMAYLQRSLNALP